MTVEARRAVRVLFAARIAPATYARLEVGTLNVARASRGARALGNARTVDADAPGEAAGQEPIRTAFAHTGGGDEIARAGAVALGYGRGVQNLTRLADADSGYTHTASQAAAAAEAGAAEIAQVAGNTGSGRTAIARGAGAIAAARRARLTCGFYADDAIAAARATVTRTPIATAEEFARGAFDWLADAVPTDTARRVTGAAAAA